VRGAFSILGDGGRIAGSTAEPITGAHEVAVAPQMWRVVDQGPREPWLQIGFVGANPGERDEAGIAPNTSLWSCKTDGTALRRLTFNLSNDMDPVVLGDGRMIYAGWLRHSGRGGPDGRVPLLGVNLDGTDYQVYAGDEGRRVKRMPAPTASGLVVFVESDALVADGSGHHADQYVKYCQGHF